MKTLKTFQRYTGIGKRSRQMTGAEIYVRDVVSGISTTVKVIAGITVLGIVAAVTIPRNS